MLLFGLGIDSAAAPRSGGEQRCGWFDNPSPGNASLHDKEGEWTIAVQGGHQAKGDWPPKYRQGQWQRTNAGGHGYGCACLTVRVDAEEKNVLEIFSSRAQPLSVCRKDRALAGVEESLR
ncbi:DUF4087 domain-containing protein [Luteimonas aquatica]|uniref:DUF4087 domain-containing protein n=1 Tax=Luteimonas aquatica TaxID=450364 RepID=UPI001F5735B7|nr:DUF4087 domain-containing protein [Luteimonas aquatica]